MSKLTITEALSEINLVKKKLETARAEMRQYLVRAKHMPDPFAGKGGIAAHNKATLQSISDLSSRLIRIRSAIAKANTQNTITVGDRTQSIHDWLTWRRELMEDERTLLADTIKRTREFIEKSSLQPQIYKEQDGSTRLVEYEIGIEVPELLSQADRLTEIAEKLDGQLSLKNATIVIEY